MKRVQFVMLMDDHLIIKGKRKILVFNMRSNDTNVTIIHLNNSIFLNYNNR